MDLACCVKEVLLLDSDLGCVDILLRWFDNCWFKSDQPLTDEHMLLKAQAQTAIVELFGNAVRHAHAGLDPAPQISLTWVSDLQGFSFSVSDHGRPFAPESMFERLRLIAAQGGMNPLERDTHWGLFLLLRLCDEHGWHLMTRRLSDGINTVRLAHCWPIAPGNTEALRLPSTV